MSTPTKKPSVAPKKKKEKKVDIFESFRKLNSLDLDFYASLSDDEKKECSPYVFLMWMQNSSNDGQVLYLNEFVNPYIFTALKDDPDRAFVQLALSTRGKQNRYQWVNRPTSRTKGGSKMDDVKAVLKEYYEETERNIGYYLDHLSEEEFGHILNEMGIQDKEQKALQKTFCEYLIKKNENGSKKK